MEQVANQAVNNRNTKSPRNPYNIGTLDRILRYLIGGEMIGSVFYLAPQYVLDAAGLEIKLYKLLPLVGIYPAVTAWLGWDPAYHLAGIKSDTRLNGDVCGSLVKQGEALARR